MTDHTWTRARLTEAIDGAMGDTLASREVYKAAALDLLNEVEALRANAKSFQAQVDAVQDAVQSEQLGDIPLIVRSLREHVARLTARLAASSSQAGSNPVSYRLPEWLGGHELGALSRADAGDERVHIAVRRPDGSMCDLAIDRADLVAVRPPSIDEPVSLNLHINSPDMVLTLNRSANTPGQAMLHIERRGNGCTTPLAPHGLRSLARTAWHLANAIEAGESQ